MTTEDLLKKYHVVIPDDVQKNSDGQIEIETAVDLIFKHGQEIIKSDPDLIKKYKDDGIKEGSIITKKRALKSLRDRFNLDFSNKEIDDLDFDEVSGMINDLTKSSKSADVAKLQAEIIDLAKAKSALEDKYNNDLRAKEDEKVKAISDYKERIAVSKLFNTGKYTVSQNIAEIIFREGLKRDGFEIRFADNDSLEIYKGDTKALNDNKTGVATLDYLADKYWSDIKQKSNGSGEPPMNTTQQNNNKGTSEAFKALERQFHRGG